MPSLWPWLVLAGVGALHGLNPTTGWMLAAAWGVHARDRKQALRALVPIAVGHAASVALVAGAVAWGLAMDRVVAQVLAGALLVLLAVGNLSGRTPRHARAPAGHAGLALWSFMMSSAHGAGLMLVPALIPLCAGNESALAAGPLVLAIAAVGVHTAAMLTVTGAVAVLACRVASTVTTLAELHRQPAGRTILTCASWLRASALGCRRRPAPSVAKEGARMEKMLHLLETFTARGSDGQTYHVQAFEHLARLDAVPDTQGQWEPTGLTEYKLADGRHVSVDKDGAMTLADTGTRLQRDPSSLGN